jgi:hypothetical protein
MRDAASSVISYDSSRLPVNGHFVLPVGGQEFSPLAAIEMSPVAAR